MLDQPFNDVERTADDEARAATRAALALAFVVGGQQELLLAARTSHETSHENPAKPFVLPPLPRKAGGEGAESLAYFFITFSIAVYRMSTVEGSDSATVGS